MKGETGNRGASPWRRGAWATALAAGVIVLATAAAFSNSFAGPFILDDIDAVTNNPTIRQLWPIGRVFCPPTQGETVTGRPLLNLSLALNYACGGTNPWGYHAVNLTIHLLAALLLLGVLRRTFLLPAMRARWRAVATPLALAIALLWAIHPLQTESVTYVVQRAESLMGLFYLLTLYCFLRGVDSARAGLWYAGSVAACLLGTLTKEVLVSAPLIVLLYDRTFVAGSFRAAWRRRGLYLALAATWLPLGWMVVLTGNRGGLAGFGLGMSWWSYFCTQFGAIVLYLRLCVWPHPLVFHYGAVVLTDRAALALYASAIGLLGLATLVALWRWPKAGFLGAWFFAILAPTSSVVPACVAQTVAEHRMYLPLAAVITGAVLCVYLPGQWLIRRQRVLRLGLQVLGVCLVIAAAIALGIVTFQRNLAYASDLSIWQDTVAGAPQNFCAQNNLGVALAGRGQLDAAMVHYRTALELDPDCAEAHNNLGIILAGRGEVEDAIAQYQRALELKSDYADAHNNLANSLAARGQIDAAIAHYRMVLDLKPDSVYAHFNLGVALAALGRPDEALDHYQKALELNPDLADAHGNLGAILADRGQIDAAIMHYQKALELKPDAAGVRREQDRVLALRQDFRQHLAERRALIQSRPSDAKLLDDTAWILATNPNPSFRNGAEAVELAQRAVKLTGNQDSRTLDTLAAAYAEAGRFAEAVQAAQKAIDLAVQQNKPAVAEAIQARRQAYETKTAFREPPNAISPIPAGPRPTVANPDVR